MTFDEFIAAVQRGAMVTDTTDGEIGSIVGYEWDSHRETCLATIALGEDFRRYVDILDLALAS